MTDSRSSYERCFYLYLRGEISFERFPCSKIPRLSRRHFEKTIKTSVFVVAFSRKIGYDERVDLFVRQNIAPINKFFNTFFH
jgi:hypothetical protein